jgi:hypothetical protein
VKKEIHQNWDSVDEKQFKIIFLILFVQIQLQSKQKVLIGPDFLLLQKFIMSIKNAEFDAYLKSIKKLQTSIPK